MKIKTFFLSCVFLTGLHSIGLSQNLLVNGDFSSDGGSLSNWGTASGTSIGNNGTDYFAILHGENGVLYQRVANVTPGKTYVCTMNFTNLNVKQTTGYGFAIEKDAALSLPVFKVGASDLKPFCENNNGKWTVLEANLAVQNVRMTYNVLMPANATAIYICLGTKGAIADMQVTSVELKLAEATKINFSVQNKKTGEPIKGAEISITGFSGSIATNIAGMAITELVSNPQPYTFSVSANWFKTYVSEVIVGAEEVFVSLQLDSIQEIKPVETRISKYGDNATPYPIYGHFWSSGLAYSDAVSDTIVKTLDYIVGGSGLDNSKAVSDKLHQLDSNFQIIRYQGGWDIKENQVAGQRKDLLYYRCGILASGISASETIIILNTTPDNKGLGLVASSNGKFATWIRMGNELMKIVSVSGTSYPVTLHVERGFDGTIAAAYETGITVTAPLYTTEPNPTGDNANLSYFEPVFGARKTDLLQNALNVASETNQDGIWIDILVGLLGAKNMVGGNYTLWNHAKEQIFSNQDIIDQTKDALDEMYKGFFSRMGYFPVIYGNNVLYSSALTAGDRAYVMVKTNEHPRGLDGFCHENSWGHMSDDSGNIDNDGEPINTNDKFIIMGTNGHYLEWYTGNSWLQNCKAIALLAENNLPNQPMTINAGYKNQWFAADLSDETRYDFNKFAYASYLLCVNVTPDSLISCRMGISPQVVKTGINNVVFQPYFYYPIGIPTQSFQSSSFTNYKVENQNIYARKFSNGIVLINPFSNDMNVAVPINQIGEKDKMYIDPENQNEEVTLVKLKSRESKILLLKPINTGIHEIREINKNIKIYPVPSRDKVSLEIEGYQMHNEKQISIELFCQTGEKIKSFLISNNTGSLDFSIKDVKPGIYFVSIPELGVLGKVIKME